MNGKSKGFLFLLSVSFAASLVGSVPINDLTHSETHQLSSDNLIRSVGNIGSVVVNHHHSNNHTHKEITHEQHRDNLKELNNSVFLWII